jgi:hypothetical protein
MLPTTKETTKRIKSLLDSTYTNTNTSSDDIPIPDTFHSYEDTFLSGEFHDTYAKTSDGDATNQHSVSASEYLWTYPFENELSTSVDTIPPKGSIVYICLYRICKGANGIPYIQYKLKNTKAIKAKYKKNQPHLVFPSLSSLSSNDYSAIIKRADEYISNTIHCERFEYKGVYHLNAADVDSVQNVYSYSGMGGERNAKNNSDADEDADENADAHEDADEDKDASSSDDSYSYSTPDKGERSAAAAMYLVYYDSSSTSTSTSPEDSSPVSVTSKTEWYWGCIHEMFNSKRILHYRVGRCVTALFTRQPIALFLVNNKGVIYETPHVLYKGLQPGVSLNEMCKFGPRIHIDDNNVSIERKKHLMKKNINELCLHGSYYYFYDYCDAIRGTCYSYDDDTNTYKKNESDECYLVRYVVFLGRLKVLMFDNMNAVTNHVPIHAACMSRETSWPLFGYDSLYHGKYTFMHDPNKKHKNLYPAFSVCDPHTFSGLSYHKIDMTGISSDIEDMFKRKKYLKLK